MLASLLFLLLSPLPLPLGSETECWEYRDKHNMVPSSRSWQRSSRNKLEKADPDKSMIVLLEVYLGGGGPEKTEVRAGFTNEMATT